MSGGTQRRSLPLQQSEELKIKNILFPRAEIKPTTCRVYSHTVRLYTTTDLIP